MVLRAPRRPARTPPPPDPSLFINRELSWLDFNERVLEEARDPSNPLLERLRFLAICASNLDEFFEVRVAGLQAQLYENLEPQDPPPDGMGPLAQLIEISRRAPRLRRAALRGLVHREFGPHCSSMASGSATRELTRRAECVSRRFFRHPGLPGPHAAGDRPGPPVPARSQQEPEPALADRVVQAATRGRFTPCSRFPSVLNRLVPLPDEADGQRRFVLLEDVIGPRLDALFGGYRTTERVAFRVTRNSDLTILENEVKSSLLSTIEETLRQRKWGAAVRLEISRSGR